MNARKTKLAALVMAVAVAAAGVAVAAEPVDMSQRTKELQSLRWGMFICWSFSTFSGKEWTPGVKDVSFFKPTGCDTDQWASVAKDARMGYILFLTKHHDGFCLWDTATTDRKVTKSPLGKDVLAQLRKSCDKNGIKLALYFSEGDWNWPGAVDGAGGKGGSDPEMKKAQLKELLTGYGPIEYIWFDHAVGTGGLSHADTVAWVKQFQPGCFVGFNHGDQQGADIRLGEMGRPGPLAEAKASPYIKGAPVKSYLLAEFTYPILPKHKGGAMWFYSLPEHDSLCKPAEAIYKDYLGAVKFGNIFSLDVGPDYAGKLRAIDVETLRMVGRMIRQGAALSGAAAAPSGGAVFNGKDLSEWMCKGGDGKFWTVGSARLDPNNPKELAVSKEGAELINAKGRGVDFWTKQAFGSGTIKLEVMVPAGSNSGLYVMGEYEVQVFDSYGKDKNPGPGDMGAIYGAQPPKGPIYKKPGEWSALEIRYEAPKFDDDGKKTANMKFVKAILNGAVIHENLEMKGPTPGGVDGKEKAKGPIMLQGNHGPVSYRNITFTPAQ
jgi:alpha-L-fucosidase